MRTRSRRWNNRPPAGAEWPAVADLPLLVFESQWHRRQAGALLGRLPPLAGAPILIRCARDLRDRRGPVHAGSFLRERVIVFDCSRAEFPRVFVHEVFHFAWLRRGNGARRSWEDLVRGELRAGARGELGWSAEWRKLALSADDIESRRRRWREYCCESFCDTAAWLYSGVLSHDEFTLTGGFRIGRRVWFRETIEATQLRL